MSPTNKNPTNSPPSKDSNKRGRSESNENSPSDLMNPNKIFAPTSLVKLDPPSVETLNNRFDETSAGPFIIQVYDKRGLRLGNLSLMSFGSRLRGHNKGITLLFRSGSDRFNIRFDNPWDANDMIDNKIKLVDPNFAAYIPDFALVKIGLIRGVDVDLSEEKILEGIEIVDDASAKVIKVQRMSVQREDPPGERYRENSSSVKVFFRCNSLPRTVSIWHVTRDVAIFFPTLRQCFKCLRFGHVEKFCRSKFDRCNRCANRHPERECKIIDESDPNSRCVNCDGNHWAFNNICPVRGLKKREGIDRAISEARPQGEPPQPNAIRSSTPFDDFESNFPILQQRQPLKTMTKTRINTFSKGNNQVYAGPRQPAPARKTLSVFVTGVVDIPPDPKMSPSSLSKANTSQISINAGENNELNDTIVSTPPVGAFEIHNERQIQEIREIARNEVSKAISRFVESLSATIQLKISNPDPIVKLIKSTEEDFILDSESSDNYGSCSTSDLPMELQESVQ